MYRCILTSLEVRSLGHSVKNDLRCFFPSELLSGDRSQMMTWSTQATDAVLSYQMSLQNPQSMTEVADQIEDGTVFFAMPAVCLILLHCPVR